MDLRNSALLSQYELPNPWVNVSYANVKVHQFYTGMKSEIGGLVTKEANNLTDMIVGLFLNFSFTFPLINVITRQLPSAWSLS